MNCEHDEVPNNVNLCPIAFTCKSLWSAEWCYSNIDQESLAILHGLERFCYYCFAKEVCVITDHKPLVTISGKDMVTLSQHLHCIMLCILQYWVCILQAWSWPIHSRLVIPKQPYRKQGLRKYCHEHKWTCHQHISGFTDIHIHRRHTGINLTGHRATKAKVLHSTGLVTQ